MAEKKRQTRSDKTVGSIEEELRIEFVNESGRNTRSDKQLGTIRKEQEKKKK